MVKAIFIRWFDIAAYRQMFSSPFFWGTLLVKLVLGTLFASSFLRDLFIPFVNYFVGSGFSNPWDHFLEHGRANAFPYPPVMLYILAVPRLLAAPFLPGGTDTVTVAHLLVFRLPLLAGDLGILLLLVRWFPAAVKRLLLFYWASPLVVYICYWHGQLDVIPTALFLTSLYLLRGRRYETAMAVLGLALGTKSHLLAAVPFLFVYLHQELGLRRSILLSTISLLVYAVSILPFALYPSFHHMVYGTEEQARLFAFQMPIGPSGLSFLLAPAALAVVFIRFAAYPRRNWDLFMLYLGILFCIFIMLVPPRPGYFLWSLPFLMYFICRTGKAESIVYYLYAASYLAFFWIGDQSDLLDAWQVIRPEVAAWKTPREFLETFGLSRYETTLNMLFTVMQVTLASIVLHMYLVGVRSNPVYRMKTTPTLVGLAGDSGAGKDTFVKMLLSVLGRDRTTTISGDDYHRWPRGDENWKVFTHLDVRSNDLHRQFKHAIALHDGKTVIKGIYDHKSGQMTEPQAVAPGQILIVSGLHALSLEPMRSLYDLKVFLDPDESLRRFWKIQRDCKDRGHTQDDVLKSMEQRETDRAAYILPQRDAADLVFRLLPETPPDLDRIESRSILRLEIGALNGFDLNVLVDELQKIATLEIDFHPYLDLKWQQIHVRGTVKAEQVRQIAWQVIPNLTDIAPNPDFDEGFNGLMQIVFLICLSRKREWYESLAR